MSEFPTAGAEATDAGGLHIEIFPVVEIMGALPVTGEVATGHGGKYFGTGGGQAGSGDIDRTYEGRFLFTCALSLGRLNDERDAHEHFHDILALAYQLEVAQKIAVIASEKNEGVVVGLFVPEDLENGADFLIDEGYICIIRSAQLSDVLPRRRFVGGRGLSVAKGIMGRLLFEHLKVGFGHVDVPRMVAFRLWKVTAIDGAVGAREGDPAEPGFVGGHAVFEPFAAPVANVMVHVVFGIGFPFGDVAGSGMKLDQVV